MDFFEHQARARRGTRSLVFLFLLAVLLVTTAVTLVVAAAIQLLGTQQEALAVDDALTANPGLLWKTALGTMSFIVIASLYRLAQLRDGGARVAESLGGNLVTAEDAEPGRRRLYNVVEEMAIASGLPVPAVYVLEHESGINAFAAGMTPSDAAVAVTRGSIDQLDRDELQGVVAHEFSHILNGDMRLNSILMGYLFGILAVGMVGRSVLRSGGRRGLRSSRSRGGGVLVLAGLGLFIVGSAGVFIGRIIQAAVCRQREFLADASAVQFSRQSEGLAGALSKIAGGASLLTAGRAEEVSHMLIAPGRHFLAGLFATHPPIEARLEALGHLRAGSMGGARTAPATAGAGDPRTAGIAAVSPQGVTEAVGRPGAPQIAFASGLQAQVPDAVWEAAHHRAGAVPLLMALLLDPESRIRERQLAMLDGRYGRLVVGQTMELAEQTSPLSHAIRLSLLDLAFPYLREMNPPRREFLLETVERMTEVDGDVDAFEAAVAGALRSRVLDLEPEATPRPPPEERAAGSAATVLAALAMEGHSERDAARRAFDKGMAALGPLMPAVGGELPTSRPRGADIRAALRQLDTLRPPAKRELVLALATAAASDGRYSERELEILRAVCSILHCPLPPLALDTGKIRTDSGAA